MSNPEDDLIHVLENHRTRTAEDKVIQHGIDIGLIPKPKREYSAIDLQYMKERDESKIVVTGYTATMTQKEFDDLPEYSTSMPTGVFIGKRWKRKDPAGGWYMLEFIEHPLDTQKCQTFSRKILMNENKATVSITNPREYLLARLRVGKLDEKDINDFFDQLSKHKEVMASPDFTITKALHNIWDEFKAFAKTKGLEPSDRKPSYQFDSMRDALDTVEEVWEDFIKSNPEKANDNNN